MDKRLGSDMPSKKTEKRFPIKLPPWHEKRLIWWALCKGTSKTMLAQNTLQARVEANAGQIEEMIEELARDKGMTITELKRKALDDAGFSMTEDDDDDNE